ncbi:DNA-3-methyladenine glycosylase [Microbacterium paraoxydans]|uniref:DNA-3-methyladenine glycosylase n=1 Tax=Microbacterium paraoxydans TaxID=199592 RepID=UPI0027DE5CD5|nr:DNA-3-methyladenine glycosylase [Microbacterium paraoxydans]
MSPAPLRRVTRDDVMRSAVDVAPTLLGAELRTLVLEGGVPVEVRVRITEVEAYHGQGTGDRADPGSHARMGRTARNATMWGEPGHLYVYLSHGIHSCVNVACGPEGQGDGVLLRAGEVVAGEEAAAVRRGAVLPLGRTARRDLARGPGRLGQAVGLRHALHDGIDAVTGEERHGARAELWLGSPVADVAQGPRVGVAGVAGTDAFPWRFWIPGDPTVSAFRWGRGAAEAAAQRAASSVLD